RFAGAITDRQGYDFNDFTNNPVNGRSLWSGRVTLGFEPTETFRGNLLWERFEEDDDRSRTGKQLCHRDNGPEVVGSRSVYSTNRNPTGDTLRRALFSQGCKPGSLYDDMAFGTPNGVAMTFIYGMLLTQTGSNGAYSWGIDENGERSSLLRPVDPYMGQMQSRDLRTIVSPKDPRYEAKADLFQLNLEWDLTGALTLSSQTAYNEDRVYSMQDFNRFNTGPIFRDTSNWTRPTINGPIPSPYQDMAPGGIFCDPQLGCSNTMVGMDISQAEAKQFSQELRLQSNFDGPMNFSVGANYTEFDALVDYYIFYNLMTALALSGPFYFPSDTDVVNIDTCPNVGYFPPTQETVPQGDPRAWCPYIDPNPIESINGEGHNYYRSKNPYDLKSTAAFGELYWNINDTLKLTAGLRYTKDKKRFKQHPSQLLLSWTSFPGGMSNKGHPQTGEINQEWGEWTGRLGLDWKPELSFTHETLLYGFYSHGYKGGGANPPRPGFATLEYSIDKFKTELGFSDEQIAGLVASGSLPFLRLTGVEYADTFKAEFVDAFEVGAKNTLFGGAMTLNVSAFYYDYKDYQISQIRDRTAVNENFDAEAWGLEFETAFAPSRDLQVVANLGYLDTEIADGESSIDIMNRTAGEAGYTLVKPWTQLPSNCVVPTHVAEEYLRSIANSPNPNNYWRVCGGWYVLSTPAQAPIDTVLGGRYDQANYPELNGGAGIRTQLGGNELPNAPHWTANIGVQYGMDMLTDWRATVRTDAYWQSQSWHRVYNLGEYDKLHGWYNVNLSIWFEKPDADLKIELYAKNLLDKTPITDAFLNSDDTALTTNVFVLDPRLIGLSIRKGF
ncbi:MAG TPA: TonB-dependent receptor, partial [Caulobacteraceae bacterium]|nr:TonB-dependent receptor [Caulobacteraceae bacterium]